MSRFDSIRFELTLATFPLLAAAEEEDEAIAIAKEVPLVSQLVSLLLGRSLSSPIIALGRLLIINMEKLRQRRRA